MPSLPFFAENLAAAAAAEQRAYILSQATELPIQYPSLYLLGLNAKISPEFAAIWNGLSYVRKHEFCKSDENWFIFVIRVTWETSDMFALGLLSLANRDDAFEHFCRPSKIDPELIYVTWCD